MPARLWLVEPAPSAFLTIIEEAAQAADLAVVRVDAPPPASRALPAPSEPSILAIGPSVETPLQTARALRSVARGPLVLLSPSHADGAVLRDALRHNDAEAPRYEVVAVDDAPALRRRFRELAQRVARHVAAVERINRQLAVEQRANASQHAQLNEHYLARILAQANDAIVSTDSSGCIVTWNAAAESLLGYGAEMAIGRGLAFLDAPPEVDGGQLRAVADRVLESDAPQQALVVCRCADGSHVHAAVSAAPIRDAAGGLLGVSLIARDESGRRQVGRQKDEFLAIMSHEFRTPLTSILGYSDMLARGMGGPLGPRTARYLTNVRTAGNRLLDLVNSLLDYSRLEAGTERLDLHALEVGDVVGEALGDLRELADAKSIDLRMRRARTFGHVLGDREKLTYAVRGYLANALKFTPDGGRVLVDVGVDPDAARMVRVSVSDSGIGLRGEQLTKVWERFYQADASLTRPYGGVGLGLSIARHIVLLHGGRVGATSPGPGKGSTFWLSLPVLPAAG